jgi:LysM repeat protein
LSLPRVLAVGGILVFAACDTSDAVRSSPSENRRATTTTAPTTTTTPQTTYQVKRGDTLSAIARQFGVSNAAIAQANQLGSEDRITEGQTLIIPPAPPAALVVTPPDGISGDTFTFTLNGAKNGETIVFEVVAPGGNIFKGSPHTASRDGLVTATYMSSGDSPGTYEVVATGDRGTSLRGSYRLLG